VTAPGNRGALRQDSQPSVALATEGTTTKAAVQPWNPSLRDPGVLEWGFAFCAPHPCGGCRHAARPVL